MSDQDKVQRIQDLRRSSAASPVNRDLTRSQQRRLAIQEQEEPEEKPVSAVAASMRISRYLRNRATMVGTGKTLDPDEISSLGFDDGQEDPISRLLVSDLEAVMDFTITLTDALAEVVGDHCQSHGAFLDPYCSTCQGISLVTHGTVIPHPEEKP